MKINVEKCKVRESQGHQHEWGHDGSKTPGEFGI